MSQILAEHEDIIFDVIREYLNKNRVFNMKKIIPYIKARIAKSSTNISYEGIQKILFSLAKKKKIVEGTKLTKKDVLIYLRRQKIYDYIRENPGKYIHQIGKELQISNKVIFWHLCVLLKFGFIKKMNIDNHTVYFDSNIDIRKINKFYLAAKEKSKEIINYLKINNIGITKTRKTELYRPCQTTSCF